MSDTQKLNTPSFNKPPKKDNNGLKYGAAAAGAAVAGAGAAAFAMSRDNDHEETEMHETQPENTQENTTETQAQHPSQQSQPAQASQPSQPAQTPQTEQPTQTEEPVSSISNTQTTPSETNTTTETTQTSSETGTATAQQTQPAQETTVETSDEEVDFFNPDDVAQAVISGEEIDPTDIDLPEVQVFTNIDTIYTEDGQEMTVATFQTEDGMEAAMIDLDGDSTFDVIGTPEGEIYANSDGSLVSAPSMTTDDAELDIAENDTYMAADDVTGETDFDNLGDDFIEMA